MLTIGVVFLIWNLVIAQSVFWLRAVAVPASLALIVTGVFIATVPFGSVERLGVASFVTNDAAWLRTRRFARVVLVIAGLSLLAIVAMGD